MQVCVRFRCFAWIDIGVCASVVAANPRVRARVVRISKEESSPYASFASERHGFAELLLCLVRSVLHGGL